MQLCLIHIHASVIALCCKSLIALCVPLKKQTSSNIARSGTVTLQPFEPVCTCKDGPASTPQMQHTTIEMLQVLPRL